MNEEELEAYVEQSQSLIDSSPQMDEQNTRRKLIEPLLELLGWNMLSADVELEYSVQMGAGTKKVDYALMMEGTPVVFVETKGVDSTVSDSHRDQLKSYMRQTGVDWGLLTNGSSFEILRRISEGRRPNESSLGKFRLDELIDNANLLRAISRELIETGESDTIAKNIETTRRAATKLQENKEEISNQITQVITKEVGESVSQTVERGAKQFVDSLSTALLDQGQPEFDIDTDRTSKLSTTGREDWVPKEGANAISGTVSRTDIDGPDDALVAVFPTRESGLKFLQENNAWGFVKVRQNIDYAAFYVAGGPQEIQYVAKVKQVVPADEATLAHDQETYNGYEAGYDPDDEVVVFEPGTLFKLEDPVPYENKAPQSRVYTDLKAFKTGSTTAEIY